MTSKILSALAAISIIIYGVIAWLSYEFDFDVDGTKRPIITVVALFGAAFLVYVAANLSLHYLKPHKRDLAIIIFGSVIFRVVMIFSLPIQEVDIYRYLWDGAVTAEGISPFAYSPDQVKNAYTYGTTDKQLESLVGLALREESLGDVLLKVHFSHLPTIYPATSQAVFASVDFVTPSTASFRARVFIMKAFLVGFDLATLLVVIGLLKTIGMPAKWSLLYGWCPILMKEFANSGHLDAIAVFLTALSVLLAARVLHSHKEHKARFWRLQLSLAVVALVLSLAIGAKLYPVVLVPLMLFVVAFRFGFINLVTPAVVMASVTAALIWPMIPPSKSDAELADSEAQTQSDPSLGVATFLKQWEMNDFLFLIAIENFRKEDGIDKSERAWFSVAPNSVRKTAHLGVIGLIDIFKKKVPKFENFTYNKTQLPFFSARLLTLSIFGVLTLYFGIRAGLAKNLDRFVEAAFLTIAWFWLLAPTLNPWYWSWALPFLPFAKNRAWIAVGGLIFIYYLRFYFEYHYQGVELFGTPYKGIWFYDLVVTWIEFAPWMLWLLVEAVVRCFRNSKPELGTEVLSQATTE